jgi:hypothetical protein
MINFISSAKGMIQHSVPMLTEMMIGDVNCTICISQKHVHITVYSILHNCPCKISHLMFCTVMSRTDVSYRYALI